MRTEEHRTRPEPPTVDEMLAYRDGTLSADDESRVREVLLCWPELLHALVAAVPDDDAGDALPPGVLERQWSAMRADRGVVRGARILTFHRAVTAIAASLAVVFGGLFWRAERELRQPRALSQLILMSDNTRGAAPEPVTISRGDGDLLSVALTGEESFESYRFILLDDAGREVWRSNLVRPKDDTLGVLLPRASVAPGRYHLVLHGISGARDEPLDRYSLRVK
jgi:hypothetical protein